MNHLSIDIETFSSVDIKKAGLYKYVQSPDFQILLFAYSRDGGPVQIVDLAQGEQLPLEILFALQDPNTIKKAYNAAFEWYCLNKFYYSPLWQWRCTQLHGLYCGYPMGLGKIGEAMGMNEDKRKMGTGMALIRTFCVPCKPTAKNGNRTRTLPHHEPEKWKLFKKYCCQDVVSEMEVDRRLSAFPVPEQEQRLWELDQGINAYGVAVDMGLVESALSVDETITGELMTEAIRLSGLQNPKSVKQLSNWLTEETGEEIADLQKGTVKKLIETVDSGTARRMLEIRQELAKTSTKKYAAMATAVCTDGRIRGLLQFYGANRTGRWCLTGDHEVLTPDGWIRLDAWDGGYIACWSPQTEFISFQKSRSVSFDYAGELYSIESQRCSQLSTPDHRMAYWGKSGGWEIDTIQNLSKKRFSVPFTGRRIVNSNLDHTELRVLIMTQADGHFTENGDLRFHFSKQRKIERCKSLLRKCGLTITWFLREKATVITIKSRNLPLWLRTFRDKTFKMWLLDESADVVFDELEHWDAYRCGPNSIQYTTINKQNADVIQALAHLSGRAATIVKKVRDNDNWNDAYIVNIWLTPGGHNEIRNKPNIVPYSGKVFCAETETGFFIVRRNGKVWITGNSGRLVQVQNLPQNHLETLAHAREHVKARKIDVLKVVYGNIPDTLSQLIRTAFIPSPGNVLLVADFSAIEARIIAWLAGEQWRLEVFATHGKIYEASASAMFGVPIGLIKKGNPEYELRQRGKVAELALGYQGGSGALISMGALDKGLTEEELPDIVRRWRGANKRIVDLWYSLENAALEVMRTGQPVGIKGLIMAREGDFRNGQDFFTITLPSGRKLFYPKPFLYENAFGREALHYWGMNQETKKWEVVSTYGGKLTENVVQAIARDCLAVALTRVTAVGYQTAMHVHDEVVLDVPEAQADLQTVCSIMGQPISWAPGLLLKATGFVSKFYKKDD
ncbi:MAG: DNA polymerase [Bacillota bacterium]